MDQTDDLTLDELRLALAPDIASAAAFDGWTMKAVENAAEFSGHNPEIARLAFADGAMAMITAWISSIDADMAAAFPLERIKTMKIRERIRSLVAFRLEAMAPHREALRRAQAIMALPQNLPATIQLGWRAADVMWRLAGDTATDYNHYTKRMTLSALYASVLAVFVDDQSDELVESYAFLDRRIDNVMQFEKVKAQILRPDAERFSVARFLGRLRYPAR